MVPQMDDAPNNDKDGAAQHVARPCMADHFVAPHFSVS
jgi:hypothetical protein